MKRRKEFHLFPLGILLFTLTLTIVSGRIAIHAADLNTELPANDSTEISSEIPTETPVVPRKIPNRYCRDLSMIKTDISIFIRTEKS